MLESGCTDDGFMYDGTRAYHVNRSVSTLGDIKNERPTGARVLNL